MNISSKSIDDQIAGFFRILGQPARIQILLTIGKGEACVCHLEAYLGLRQAAISQQLMVLREAGMVTANREGRNIFYRLARPELLDLVREAAKIAGIPQSDLDGPAAQPAVPCPCPHCNPEAPADFDCSHVTERLSGC